MKRPTLVTIAEKSGVSKPVVYTVLKNRQGTSIRVSKATREKILRVAEECGYVPPKSSRMLATGKSDTIGVLIHLIIPPFSELLTHIQRSAQKEGLDVIPYITDNNPVLEEYYLNLVRDGRVDGIIPLTKTDGSDDRYRKYSCSPYHLTLFYYGEPIAGIPSVHFDAPAVGRLAAKHLLEIGCRRIAFFGRNPHLVRVKSFCAFLRKRGVIAEIITRPGGRDFFRDAMAGAKELMKMKPLPDGIFAVNDILGVAILNEARKRGIRIPDDLAVVGCDNTEFAAYASPGLTSIDINPPLLAARLVLRIKGMIEGKKTDDSHETLPVRLVVRESTMRAGR